MESWRLVQSHRTRQARIPYQKLGLREINTTASRSRILFCFPSSATTTKSWPAFQLESPTQIRAWPAHRPPSLLLLPFNSLLPAPLRARVCFIARFLGLYLCLRARPFFSLLLHLSSFRPAFSYLNAFPRLDRRLPSPRQPGLPFSVPI